MKDETVSLKDYFESRLDALDKATTIARQSMETRLNSMNEFRDTLKDQAARFTTRDELNLITDRLEIDIKNLEAAKAQMLPLTTYESYHASLVKQVDELRISGAVLAGKATQESVNSVSSRAQLGLVIASIAAIAAIINFITKISGH